MVQPRQRKSCKISENASTFKKTVALLRGMRDSTNITATIDTSTMSLSSQKKVLPDQFKKKFNSKATLVPLNLDIQKSMVASMISPTLKQRKLLDSKILKTMK